MTTNRDECKRNAVNVTGYAPKHEHSVRMQLTCRENASCILMHSSGILAQCRAHKGAEKFTTDVLVFQSIPLAGSRYPRKPSIEMHKHIHRVSSSRPQSLSAVGYLLDIQPEAHSWRRYKQHTCLQPKGLPENVTKPHGGCSTIHGNGPPALNEVNTTQCVLACTTKHTLKLQSP